MRNVAAGLMSTFGEALLRPGDNERDLGLRYADTLRHLGPLAAPTLGRMLNLRLREVIRDSAVGQAELHSGHLPGAQPVTVGFVDIVGFTRLGEEIPPEDLGVLVREFERSVERVTSPQVRLVKTIGDAAMLVAPTPKPVVDAVLGLVEESRGDDDRPMLRGGIASGEALPRVGRLVRPPRQPRVATYLVRAARQRRGVEGRPRRRPRERLRVVVRRQPALQGPRRGGPGVPRADRRARARR